MKYTDENFYCPYCKRQVGHYKWAYWWRTYLCVLVTIATIAFLVLMIVTSGSIAFIVCFVISTILTIIGWIYWTYRKNKYVCGICKGCFNVHECDAIEEKLEEKEGISKLDSIEVDKE